jgi:hypothetical protein
MSKFKYVLIVVVLFALVGTAAAQGDEPVLFEADFNNGKIPTDFSVSQQWEVVKQGRNVVLHADASKLQTVDLVTGVDWTDYAYEVSFKLTKGVLVVSGRVGNGSLKDLCSAYGVAVFGDDRVIDLLRFNNKCEPTVLDELKNFEGVRDSFATLRLEMIGSQIKAYIDGEQVLSADDTTYEKGFPSIYILKDSEVFIDSVKALDLQGSAVADTTSSTAPTLVHYADDPDVAISELQDLGYVATSGQLLFQEPKAFFNGKGSFFTPLARRSPRTNVVMAGELDFTVGKAGAQDFQFCGLISRINTDNRGTAVTYVEVSIANTGDLLIRDVSKEKADATTLDVKPLGLDLSQPHHLLIHEIGTQLDVFVDGVLAAENEPVVDREGTFGIALISKSKDSKCEGRNIWVYDFD